MAVGKLHASLYAHMNTLGLHQKSIQKEKSSV